MKKRRGGDISFQVDEAAIKRMIREKKLGDERRYGEMSDEGIIHYLSWKYERIPIGLEVRRLQDACRRSERLTSEDYNIIVY